MSYKPFKCPACEFKFNRHGHEVCPECKTPLPPPRGHRKRESMEEIVTGSAEMAVSGLLALPWKEVFTEGAELVEIPTPPIPPGVQVWETKSELYPAHIEFDPRGGTGGNGRYKVDFRPYKFVPNYVYCPAPRCGKKMFQNMDLRGSCEHVCQRCKSRILFLF